MIRLKELTAVAAAVTALAGIAWGVSADTEIHDHDGHGHGHGHGHSSGVHLVITDADRFDPLVQQLLLKQQLAKHPVIDKPKFVVIPHNGEAELTEAQIRYLERLLAEAEE